MIRELLGETQYARFQQHRFLEQAGHHHASALLLQAAVLRWLRDIGEPDLAATLEREHVSVADAFVSPGGDE